MNTVLLLIILIPIVEIYFFIKVGSYIGAFATITLIFLTAVLGVYYVKFEGFNTLRSGITQLMRNETPFYEILSGAALAFAALFLIFPGFITDFMGLILVLPFTRKLIIGSLSKRYEDKNKPLKNKNFIDGEFEDIEDDKK
jgi:UPF0716 protein FxsA|tara:strand:+ start:1347 stop:1769 length:423 start_codon:yes stop_codon:yes gene_type:complete